MKNIMAFVFFAALVLVGCDSKNSAVQEDGKQKSVDKTLAESQKMLDQMSGKAVEETTDPWMAPRHII